MRNTFVIGSLLTLSSWMSSAGDAAAGPNLTTYLQDNSECVGLYSLGSSYVARQGEEELSGQLQEIATQHLNVVLLVATELALAEKDIKARLAEGMETISGEVGDGFSRFPDVISRRAEYCRLSAEMPEMKISMLKDLQARESSGK